MTSSNEILTVACDGSCLVNPGGPTGWAWCDENGGFAAGGILEGTNNIAELSALLQVLISHPETNLHILIDSQYAMNSATVWLEGWKKRGWKTSGGKPVANLDLIQQIDYEMVRRRQIGLETTFQWVKGHDVNNTWPLNTRADELCGQAAHRAATGDVEILRG